MLFAFICGGEKVFVRSTVTNIFLKSSATKNQFMELTPELFKRDREKYGKIKHILSKWPTLTEDEKKVYIISEFSKMGYSLRRWSSE